VVVSTDSDEIKKIAEKFGAKTISRPPALATDDSPERLAWRHAIENSEPFDIFVSVPAPCPLRNVSDIDRCVETLLNNPDTDTVLTVTRSHGNPYSTMVSLDAAGVAGKLIPGHSSSNRQEAPKVYDIVGVAYATRPEFVMRADGIWDGKIKTVEVPQERALDIDTEYDFKVAELLLTN
jgi:CMP-N-acetylneuraminic acid synthetase